MSADRKYIEQILWPELLDRFDQWEQEYEQERDLGVRGEFVGLYRKTRKLKTALWDRPEPPTNWRESLRTIMFEIAAHALLMLCDWDRDKEKDNPIIKAERKRTLRVRVEQCSAACRVAGDHTFGDGCIGDCVACDGEHTNEKGCRRYPQEVKA